MNEIRVANRKAEIFGIIGFIMSLIAISLGVEFSIAGLILTNICLKDIPEHSLAKAGRIISIIGIVFVSVFMFIVLCIFASRR